MATALWQFAGSLFAVASLAWLAFRFGFSGHPELHSEAEAAHLADEISGGFVPVATLLSESRNAALLRDGAGRLALVAPSGAHFVSRLLSPKSRIQRQASRLQVRDGDLSAEFEIGATTVDWKQTFVRLR